MWGVFSGLLLVALPPSLPLPPLDPVPVINPPFKSARTLSGSPRNSMIPERALAGVNAEGLAGLAGGRSAHSLRLEALVRRGCQNGLLPRLEDLQLEWLPGMSGWLAVVHPDAVARRLTICHAGAGLSAMQADPMTGTDYLDLVDPAYKGEAFDATFMMLLRPCGLWQLAPVRLSDGSIELFEFTGFPRFDHGRGQGVVVFLIWNPTLGLRTVRSVGHSEVWSWLDMR
jgi:hypothetical protein